MKQSILRKAFGLRKEAGLKSVFMKKPISIILLVLLIGALMLGGCSNDNGKQEEPPKETPQVELSTVIGEFQGLADGHSAEILIDGEAQVYQFFDDAVTSAFETMEGGTTIQFDVETDGATGVQTIVKVYDAPAQG